MSHPSISKDQKVASNNNKILCFSDFSGVSPVMSMLKRMTHLIQFGGNLPFKTFMVFKICYVL